jgi:hypothetical protein
VGRLSDNRRVWAACGGAAGSDHDPGRERDPGKRQRRADQDGPAPAGGRGPARANRNPLEPLARPACRQNADLAHAMRRRVVGGQPASGDRRVGGSWFPDMLAAGQPSGRQPGRGGAICLLLGLRDFLRLLLFRGVLTLLGLRRLVRRRLDERRRARGIQESLRLRYRVSHTLDMPCRLP